MAQAEVVRTGGETSVSVIRKFTRRVQGTGIIRLARKQRYYARSASKVVKKKRALKMLKRREEYRQLVKEGKVAEAPARRGGPQRETREQGSQSRFGESTPIAR